MLENGFDEAVQVADASESVTLIDDGANDTDILSMESEDTTPTVPSIASSRPSSPPTSPSAADVRRWRPRYHVMPVRGWMNDPCAPGYDSRKGVYSLGFQWNPYGYKWGNMSWGSATSRDLVTWNVSPSAAMEPTTELDSCGVFTGCLMPDIDNIQSSQDLPRVAFYTSAQQLPITYKQQYVRGSERLHMATSTDNGQSWKRPPDNIILPEPPTEFGPTVRSWRDPFVGAWPAIDRLLGVSESKSGLYGIIAGSIHERSPAVFLYRLDRDDFRRWEFIGNLVDIAVNFYPSPWSGDFGVNWEVANFVDLTNPKGLSYSLLITGVEGVQKHLGQRFERSEIISEHKQMWMCGTTDRDSAGRIRMQYQFGGILDHGSFYAANGFQDPMTGNFVTFGWIFEEDLSPELVARQGWSGCLSIPRVISIRVIENITKALKSDMDDISCIKSSEMDGVHTATVLSISPDPRLELLRVHKLHVSSPFETIWFEESMRRHWECKASWRVEDRNTIGMEISHDSGQYIIPCSTVRSNFLQTLQPIPPSCSHPSKRC
jgi:beta-fructofuranosidase